MIDRGPALSPAPTPLFKKVESSAPVLGNTKCTTVKICSFLLIPEQCFYRYLKKSYYRRSSRIHNIQIIFPVIRDAFIIHVATTKGGWVGWGDPPMTLFRGNMKIQGLGAFQISISLEIHKACLESAVSVCLHIIRCFCHRYPIHVCRPLLWDFRLEKYRCITRKHKQLDIVRNISQIIYPS